MRLRKIVSKPAWHIIQFAFTEMLNNAIEHSGSKNVSIDFVCDGRNVRFQIADKGMGVFENLKRKFKLRDHFEACEHLLR